MTLPDTALQDIEWARALSAALPTEIVGHPLVAYRAVDSTNDVAKDLALHGGPDGLTVVARTQTHGRGRRGRAWVSFRDQAVYLSVLLRPPWKSDEVTWLGVLGGVAAAEAVAAVGVPNLEIKWPNDVLCRGRKIGGVLVEPRLGDERLAFAVLGVGINVLQTNADWPDDLKPVATSCAAEGSNATCDDVSRAFLGRLDDWYRRLLQGERQSLLEAWSRWSGSPALPELD